ncbi:MAG: hypothetical protein HYX25_06615 [Candidatus Solibacter usitatus]|nr:hypothetical protein [Candidatus Solibacter usitatus]
MKWAVVLVFSSILGAVEIAGLNVQSVYVMPMSGGLDQFLAHQITRTHTFSVVTDAKRADAIFTDRLGDALHTQLEKLYPEPKPVSAAAKKKDDAKKDDDAKGDEKTEAKADAKEEDPIVKGDPITPARATTNTPPPVSGFGRGKGTVFLVDAKSRRVIWSAYAKPKNTSSDELARVAHQVIGQLTKTLAGK